MNKKQELLIGLTTNNIQALVDNLANTNLTLEAVCENREEDFVKGLTDDERMSVEDNKDTLIALLEKNQFVAPDPISDFAPFKSEQEKINYEARQYLNSTDWYVTRKLEKNIDMPQNISNARDEARDKIIEEK
jgi:hypothetical protein